MNNDINWPSGEGEKNSTNIILYYKSCCYHYYAIILYTVHISHDILLLFIMITDLNNDIQLGLYKY